MISRSNLDKVYHHHQTEDHHDPEANIIEKNKNLLTTIKKDNHRKESLASNSYARSQDDINMTRKYKNEIWTQKLQYVVLKGDRISFYSVEIDQHNILNAVRAL
jgi:hypothetical protein